MIKLKDILFELKENDSNDSGGVLYYNGNKVLLCLSSNTGIWNVPKGHIMIKEKPLEGSIREFTEETQIMLNGEPELVLTKNNKKGKFYLFKFETDKQPIPHLDHEHEKWGYFDETNLPQPFDETIM